MSQHTYTNICYENIGIKGTYKYLIEKSFQINIYVCIYNVYIVCIYYIIHTQICICVFLYVL